MSVPLSNLLADLEREAGADTAAAFVNPRTTRADLERVLDGLESIGGRLLRAP